MCDNRANDSFVAELWSRGFLRYFLVRTCKKKTYKITNKYNA